MRWSWINSAFPGPIFWRNALVKVVSILVSLKFWLLCVTTILLLKGRISDSIWATVITTLAAGRIAVQTLATWRHRKILEEKQLPKEDDSEHL